MADMNHFNAQVITEFRANDGKVGGQFEGAPMVLVTHRGAKSGAERTTPLVYSRDGDRVVIIASKAGAPDNPAWYHNLVAHPEVAVELGSERYTARAVEVEDPERQRLFDQQAAILPVFAGYQAKTSRTIPVFVLQRTSA